MSVQTQHTNWFVWAPCSHWVISEFPCIPKYYWVTFEAICLTAKAWPKLGHAAGQWSQAHQQVYYRMAEKQKNQRVAMAQAQTSTWLEHCYEQKQRCKGMQA